VSQWDDAEAFPAGTKTRKTPKEPLEELPRPMPYKTGNKKKDFKIEQLEGLEWSLKKRRR
jgi:hypothetical protein